jgi:hypothetical protein
MAAAGPGTVAGRGARTFLLAAQVASLAAFAWPLRRAPGFPLDDAWIHHVVARTLATSGTLGFRPGAHGAGATSYAWAALLAIGHLVHAAPVVFTDALGALSALAAGQVILALFARRDGRVAWTHLVAVTFACAGGDLTWFALSGMEAALVVALSAGAVLAATRARAEARGYAIAGVLAAGAALTRPDAMPLGACLAAWAFVRTRSVKRALLVAAPWAVACAIYFGSNILLAGHALPATLAGRRWLWIESTDPAPSLLGLAGSFADAWCDRLRHYTLRLDGVVALFLGLGLAAAGLLGQARELLREKDGARRAPAGVVGLAAWCALHVLVFLVVLPVPGHGGRYQPLVPVLFVLFASLGALELAGGLGRRLGRERLAIDVATVAWFACAFYAWSGWRTANADAVAHIAATEEAAGRAVAALPADARVATFDVGAIAYVSGRPVLDLGGLTDARVVGFLTRDAIAELLERDRVTHVVLPDGDDPALDDLSNFAFRLGIADNPMLETTPIFALRNPDRARWLDGVDYTQNATIQQIGSRVRFTGCAPWPRDRARGAQLVSGLALSGPAERRMAKAFADADASGLCVRLSAGGAPAPAPAPGCWTIELAPGGASIRVAPADVAPDAVVAARAELDARTKPYLAAGDLAGAAKVSLHALARVTQETIARCFWTRLPPIDPPVPASARSASAASAGDSVAWGIPLALAACVLAMRAARA